MVPPAGPLRHHCSFKMPQNPRYKCPRAGNMDQMSGDVYCCAHHDKYAKDRCQAFSDFQDSSMQCPEMHTMIDQDTGKKYCDKHEPSSEVPEVVDWNVRMTEWLTSVASAEPLREDANGFSKDAVNEVSLVVPEPELESELERQSDTAIEPELQTEPLTEPQTEPEHKTQDTETSPSKHEIPSIELGTEQGQDQVLAIKVEPKPEPTQEQTPEQNIGPVVEHEHIAALYMQCNICLESHNATDMSKIESCGHQYKESCLQEFLRRKGVRKYNCTACQAWLQSHQEP